MKKIIFLMILFIYLSFFLFHSQEFIQSSKNGISLWFEQILPTLLPFTILSNCILSSNLFESNAKKTSKKLLTIPEAFVLIGGFIFGFPIASKLSCDFYNAQKLDKKSAQILCCFANQMSPAFVIGFVCNTKLKSASMVLPFCLILYLPSFIITVFLLIKKNRKNFFSEDIRHKNTASSFQMNMKIIDAGIVSGFLTLIKLCGYIMIFSIAVSIITTLKWIPQNIKIIIIAALEITNAVNYVCENIYKKNLAIVIMIAAITFGGFSGIAQTASILANSDLSIKKYFYAKIYLTLLSALLCISYLTFR